MRHLSIRSFGPLESVDIEIGRLNVIVGPQSSGKSSVLKVSAFFAWLEKRIELTQNLEEASGEGFEEHLVKFYHLIGYVSSTTEMEYETDGLLIKYKNRKMTAEWKPGRWEYKRSKIAYIPAERDIVSVIGNWQKVQAADNILEFMTEWDIARQSRVKALKILNLGVQYSYDKNSNSDKVFLDSGVDLDLSSTSSGLQSLIPLFVCLNYLHRGQYRERYKMGNYQSKSENSSLLDTMVLNLAVEELPKASLRSIPDVQSLLRKDITLGEFVDGAEKAIKKSRFYSNFTDIKNSQVYLEEPEDNLFPPEQVVLTEWLIAMGNDRFRKNVMFLATHSPYVVNCFLEREKKDFNLFITVPAGNGKSTVKTVSEEELQRMYDSGVDVFFNYEAFV